MTIDKQLLDTLVQLFYWIVALAITVPITVLYYFVVEVGGFSPLLFSLIVVAVATLVGVGYYFMKKLHHKNSD